MSSKYLKVECKCGNSQIIFSHTTSVVKCNSCKEPLAHPTGGTSVVHCKVAEELDQNFLGLETSLKVVQIVELPDEDELVIAVIKKIMPYGAFCTLTEYGNLEAFVHVSEVAPRWIKNIHEFISEGQRYVVKVHHVDREKNQVDISIKRVSEEEKKHKLELVQNEKRGSKLLEITLEASKDLVKGLEPAKVRKEIETHFDDIYSCFRDASYKGEDTLKKLDLPKPLKAKIYEIAVKSIKKPTVEVSSVVNLVCYNPDGVLVIKNALKVGDDIVVHYLGAPRYQLSLTASDYKSAEKRMGAVLEHIKTYAQKNNCDFKSDRD